MTTSAVLAAKVQALDMLLRRVFWQPLRRMMEIFHTLPLTAALIVFILLATDAQVREIYVAYLEDLQPDASGAPPDYLSPAVAYAAAALGLALISAVLYVAHYRLSTMRINIITAGRSHPESRSTLRTVQRVAAMALSLFPWLGVVAGLLDARIYLADRYHQLHCVAAVESATLTTMQHLPLPSAGSIGLAAILVGLAAALFLDANRHDRILKAAGVALLPLGAAALFVLLTESFSGGDDGIETHRIWLILAAIVLAFYAVNFWLHRTRARFVSASWFHRDTGVNVRRRRRALLVAWAILPWIAIAFYFALGPTIVMQPAMPPPPPCMMPAASASLWPQISRWAMFPVAMAWAIAVGIGVVLGLDRLRESAAMQLSVALVVIALLIVAIATSFLDVNAIVSLYREVGPIGSMTLEMLFMISMLALLALLSQRSGFPALALVVLATVVTVIFPIPVTVTVAALTATCGLIVVMALLSRLWAVAIVAALLTFPGVITLHDLDKVGPADPNPKPLATVGQKFECWLDDKGLAASNPDSDMCPHAAARPNPAAAGAVEAKRYPVFIIAVEGGGIYAASAASLFLARLQDRLPDFSEHVFAISAVSGGAIGATIFQALAQSNPKGDARKPSPAAQDDPAADTNP